MLHRLKWRLLNILWYRWTRTGPVIGHFRYAPHRELARVKRGSVIRPLGGLHGLYSALVWRQG